MSTTYRVGSWFGIAGGSTTVILPPEASALVGEVWSLVDDGGNFEAVRLFLDNADAAALPKFLLIDTDGPSPRVASRGDVEGVAAPGPALSLVPPTETADEPEAFEDEDEEFGDIDPEINPDEVATEFLPPVPSIPVPPVVAPVPVPAVASVFSVVPPVVPEVSADAETDEQPVVEEPFAPAPVVKAVPTLTFSHGEEVAVDQVIVVGRAPAANRIITEVPPLLVTVPSPHHEISSTHLEVRPGEGANAGYATVTDLGSTNGTIVVQPGSKPEDLRPGIPVKLEKGATVDLGDGLTITVS